VKQGEAKRHQSSGTGLAATKHRPAFNTGWVSWCS